MITNKTFATPNLRFAAAIVALFLLGACATPRPAGRPQDVAAAASLRKARSPTVSAETRAADYLQAASLTEPQLGDGTVDTPAREIYNAACAELTMLLRSAEGGSLWNHPLTLPANNA